MAKKIVYYECKQVEEKPISQVVDDGDNECIEHLIQCLQKEYDLVAVTEDEIRVFYFIPG